MGSQATRQEIGQAIGEIIKRKRNEKGYSVYKLSMVTFGNSYHANAIAEYEKGVKIPDIEKLNKILLSLDLNIFEILKNY